MTNVFIYPKKYYRVRPFSHPRDRQFEGAKMGTSVTCMDDLVEKRVSFPPLLSRVVLVYCRLSRAVSPTYIYIPRTVHHEFVSAPRGCRSCGMSFSYRTCCVARWGLEAQTAWGESCHTCC